MNDFVYCGPTKYIFGRDSEKLVGREVLNFGKKVLLHYGSGSIKKTGLYDSVVESLKNNNIEVFELGGVLPNPRLGKVREGINICKANDIDLILAVGGGSVIDSAKAIAAGHRYNGDVWDFFTFQAEPEEATPVATILTIAAAGSEGSTGCVITKEEGNSKRFFNSELVIPKFSILNPELTFTVSKYQTGCGCVDIIAHLMERYFTNVKHVELTDRLIEATLKTVIDNAKILIKDLQNYDARAEVMWSGTIAHNNLLDTGRIGDWASHMLEHEISAIYDVAHGAGLAIVFPAWMKYVYKHDLNRFAQFAVRVFNVEMDYFNIEKTAFAGIIALENFFMELDMPVRLNQINVDGSRIEEMAGKGVIYGPVGEFVKLDKSDLIHIYTLALS